MADVILYSVFDIYLIGIGTVLSLITAIRYFGLAKRKENPSEKSIVKAVAWIWVFFTILLILLTLSLFYLEGEFIGYIYRGNFDNPSLIYMWLAKGAYIAWFAAFIFYFYTYEKILNKRIHLAPFGCILIIILIIFLPYELAMYEFFPIAFTIIGIYAVHTWFTLMKKSQRELRAATSFIIIGNLFISLLIVYMSPVLMRLGDTPILIFPILFIFGTLLIISPTVFKPEFFSRNIKYWYLFSIIYIGAMAINLVYMVVLNQIELILAALFFLIFYAVECLILIRFIKREEVLGVEGDIGVRGIFTKPEKVTEEEVSISKEKKICLVCKGKVLRNNIYLCPECSTFYCLKCSEALSNLENACWVCETPFDESKPVKPFKKEAEIDVEISEKPQKKL